MAGGGEDQKARLMVRALAVFDPLLMVHSERKNHDESTQPDGVRLEPQASVDVPTGYPAICLVVLAFLLKLPVPHDEV